MNWLHKKLTIFSEPEENFNLIYIKLFKLNSQQFHTKFKVTKTRLLNWLTIVILSGTIFWNLIIANKCYMIKNVFWRFCLLCLFEITTNLQVTSLKPNFLTKSSVITVSKSWRIDWKQKTLQRKIWGLSLDTF